MSNKNILIIDDDISIRFTLKKLFSRYLSGLDVKIYTSSDGVQGLGYAYIVKPDLIIIDSTLPKYSGRELVDYLVSNAGFSNVPVVVLNENGNSLANLPANYFQISKKDKDFPYNLIRLVLDKIGYSDSFKLRKSPGFRLFSFLCKKIIKHSNESDIETSEITKSQNIFKKTFNSIQYVYEHLITSFYLTIFYLFIGKKDSEESVQQKKKDLLKFRAKIYPALAVTIATLIVFLIGATLLITSVLGITLIGKEVTHAAVAYTWSGGGTDGTCGGAVGDGNKWSCVLNWTPNGNPTATDTITFNATSTKDVTVDSGFSGSVSTINIAAGYTGTITLQRSLQTTSTFRISAGTFNAANQTLDVDSTFTMDAGSTFTASSTISSFGGNFTINGGTFNHNSGTVSFDNTGTLSCKNITFNLVTFSGTGGYIVNSDCSLPIGTPPAITNGITLNGTLSGSGTLNKTLGSFTLNAGATLSGFTGLSATVLSVAGATADFSSYSTFATSGTLTLSSGTLTLPNDTDLNGVFVISGGIFNAPVGTMTLAASLTISGTPTFNANGGTITFDGGSATLSCNNVTFSKVSFNNTSGKTVNSNCNLPLGNNPTLLGTSTINLNGTFSGTGTLSKTASTLGLTSATGTLSGFSGLSLSAFTVSGGIADLSSYTSFATTGIVVVSSGSLTLPDGADLNGALTISGGTFIAPSGTMTLAGALTISGTPTFNANGGTITFDGGGTLSCNNVTFSHVTFNNSSTTIINSNCNLPIGNDPILVGAGRITLNGTLTGTGTIHKSSEIFTLNSGAVLSGFNGLDLSLLTVAGAIADFSGYSTFSAASTVALSSGSLSLPNSGADLNGYLTITGGTFTAPSGTMTLGGPLTISGTPIFNANGGIIESDGLSNTYTCNNVTFNLVKFTGGGPGTVFTINNTCIIPLGNNPVIGGRVSINGGILAGSGTITGNGGFKVSSGAGFAGFNGMIASHDTFGALNVQGGTVDLSGYNLVDLNQGGLQIYTAESSLTAPSGNMNISGDFMNMGTFNHNNGTIVLDGTNQTLTGSTTFNALSKTSTSANTLTFTSGTTQTILGTLTLKGTSGSPLSLRSSIPGTQWNIDPQGAVDLEYLDVQDSNNINANALQVAGLNVVDSGNNTGWNFFDPAVSNLGPVNYTNGSYVMIDKPTLAFNITDSDSSQQIRYRIQISDNSSFTSPVIDYTSALSAQGSKSFTVGQVAGSGTYTTGGTAAALENKSYYWRVQALDELEGSSAYLKAGSGSNVSFKIDTIKPEGYFYIVNNTTTEEEDKDVYIFSYTTDNFSGVGHMLVSENPNFPGAVWEEYKTTKEYTFDSYGTKNLYIKYKDNAGHESIIYTRSITLTGPEQEEQPTEEEQPVEEGQAIAIRFVDENGNPIVGMKVTIQELGISAITNNEGYAVFENIPQGEYEILGVYGEDEFKYTITVSEDEQVTTIVLEKKTGTLTYVLGGISVILGTIVIGFLIIFLKRRKKEKHKRKKE